MKFIAPARSRAKARMLDASCWADRFKPEAAEYSPTHLPTQFSVRFT